MSRLAWLAQIAALGSSVTLRPQTVDRFGRTVAEVISDVNLNLAQCNAKEYLDAEFRASRSRYGVWRVPGGITRPWDFRRNRRSSGGSNATSQRAAPAGSAIGSWSGQRYRCRAIGSFARAQELLRQGGPPPFPWTSR